MNRSALLWAILPLLSPAAALAQSTILTGAVVDSITARPVSGVELYMPGKKGVLSDKDGVFRLRDVPSGRSILIARRLGYVPMAFTLEVSDSVAPQVEIGTLRMKPMATVLNPIVVESTLVAISPRLSDFYRRRKQGGGNYITQDEIWKKNPIYTSDLLRDVPGVNVSCYAGSCTITSNRTRGIAAFVGRGCPMGVVLDGVPTSITLDEIPPGWIAGIEVYKGIAFMPMELSRNPCGVVAIWTGPDLSARAQLEGK